MTLSIELERKEHLTVGEWEGFLRQARQAGASDDTPVTEVTSDQWPDVTLGYRVQITEPAAAGPEQVTLPTQLVHDLLFVASEAAGSDGDIRGLEIGAQRVLRNVHGYLLAPVLGENPYSSEDQDEDSPG